MRIRLVKHDQKYIDVEMPMPPRIGERCLYPGTQEYRHVIEVNYSFTDKGDLLFIGVQLHE